MGLRGESVDAALDRWERSGLIERELAARLREETAEHQRRAGGRIAQYALASTGALILLIAAGVFAEWLWPYLEAGARAIALGLVGGVVYLFGLRVRRGERWRAASYLLQIAGLLILLGTFAYSDAAWPAASPGGIIVGLLALVVPLVTAPRSLLARDPVMPAAHLALGLAFFATFLWRALGLEGETIVWVLDALLALLALLLVRELGRARHADEADWALGAFVTAVYAAFFLILFTGVGPLDMGERVVYPLDAWVLGLAALTLWGIHRAPPPLQRAWYERQLAFSVVVAVPLLFQTSQEVWDAPEEMTSLLVAGLGALALLYGVRTDARATLFAGCFAVFVAAWYFGLDQGGALGVALALAASAALLFWISTRAGWRGGAASVDGRGERA